jgi:S-(hydroxymethyl)glutathione dehydrogenase/alcohol dehydrogenase
VQYDYYAKNDMKTKAAIAWQAGQSLATEEVALEGAKAGQVLVEVKAADICHTDYYTLSGADVEGIFPAILGHEGTGMVVDVGPGVTSLVTHHLPLEQINEGFDLMKSDESICSVVVY